MAPIGETTLRLKCWNVRGITTAFAYLNHLLESSDVIAISEHWLYQCSLSVLDSINKDFCTFGSASRDLSNEDFGKIRGQGGVAIMWRKNLPGVCPLNDLTNDRICGIRMQNASGRTTIILSVYLPSPSSHSNTLDEVVDDLQEIVESKGEG